MTYGLFGDAFLNSLLFIVMAPHDRNHFVAIFVAPLSALADAHFAHALTIARMLLMASAMLLAARRAPV